MSTRATESDQPIGDVKHAAERLPFLRSKVFIGAVKRGIRPGITAALLLEESCLYAERKYNWTGVAAAGAILSECLWTYSLEKERRDREGGAQR
jgi:hypothetical protein